MPPSLVEFEITESTVMTDTTRALAAIGHLRSIGAGTSLDDFGTGHSSLAHLQRLPVDQLKIDRSFVVNMATNEKDAFIVRSTVTLGRDLGLKIVAEGVEDELTAGLLERLGCDLIQGYFVSKPLSAQELMDWLAAQSRAAAPSVGAVPHDGEVATTPPAAAARAGTPGTDGTRPKPPSALRPRRSCSSYSRCFDRSRGTCSNCLFEPCVRRISRTPRRLPKR